MKTIAVWFFLINGQWVHDAVLHPDVVAHDAKSCAVGAAFAEVHNESIKARVARGERPTYKSIPIQGIRVECREVAQ